MNGEEAMVAGLVIRARNGDRRAFEQLVDRYARLIWAICRDFELEESPSADVAQMVWLRLLEHIDRLREPFDVGRWIAATARNECLRALSARKYGHHEQPAGQAVSNLRARMRASVTGFCVRGLTGLAAFLAGREGPALLDESDGHLAGESGHDPLSWSKAKEAAGFVVAGVRYRGQDWADAVWKPAEVVLRSRFLSGLFLVIPTIVVAVEVLTHKGTMTLFTSFGSIFATGTFLSTMIKAGRKYREVEPPEPRMRRARNEDQDT